MAPGKARMRDLVGSRLVPFTHFALLAQEYMTRNSVSADQIGMVAVKNNRNGANNPYAQRQKAKTLEEVMAGPAISGSLTRLQCCPIGEGAAAVIVASDDAIGGLGIDRKRAVRVIASVTRTEQDLPRREKFRRRVDSRNCRAGLSPKPAAGGDLNLIELHDAFTIEELLYVEAMGLCAPGMAAGAIAAGEFDIGGRCAVSASGGLLAMGHPIGPTGAGQIAELTSPVARRRGVRQQPNAKTGLAHMVGVGAVCVVHILRKDA